MSVDEIPAEAVSRRGDIAVLSIGKIGEPVEGCACLYGLLAKEFLKNFELREDEVALVDTEAGIEHFGRGLNLLVNASCGSKTDRCPGSILKRCQQAGASKRSAGKMLRQAREFVKSKAV
jgi:hypothetical protein